MKKYVHASMSTTISQLEKAIRSCIYSIWTRDSNGKPIRNFFDPDSLENRMIIKYVEDNLISEITFSEWIFNQADDLFADGLDQFLSTHYPEDLQQIGWDYFVNLDKADYSRNLYLKRTEKEIERYLAGKDYSESSRMNQLF